MKNIYKISISVFALLFAWQVYAVTLSTPADLALDVSPKSPRPGAPFAVSAKSFAFDMVRAKFTWFLDGKNIASGVGLREQNFQAEKVGSEMNVRVDIISADGVFYEASAKIIISDIDFIIHPLTYAPSFYRGSALATPGSVVEIIAVPHIFFGGERLKPQNLIYEWSIDDKPFQNKSGGGKNKFSVKLADVGNSNYIVALKVSTLDGAVSAQKSVNLKTAMPEILFYETNSLTGLKPAALNSFFGRAGDSFSILAEPFYFDLASLARAKFNWSAGGAAAESNPKNPLLLELAAPANTDSQTAFNLKIEDGLALFQQAEALINISATK